MRQKLLSFLILSITAIVTSTVIVSFLKLCQLAVDYFRSIVDDIWWIPLFWTPILTMIIVFITIKYVPGIAGSGNQQVKASLETENKGVFVSLKIAIYKYFLTAAGFFAGLSIGREGPTVQIAASMMHSVRDYIPKKLNITPNFLIGVGGAIGIAVAFKAIIAGTVFALEETAKTFRRNNRVLFFTLITLGITTCYILEGIDPFYAKVEIDSISYEYWVPILLTAISSSVLGGLFAKSLLFSMPNKTSKLGRFKSDHPIKLAGILGLVIAIIGILSNGITYSDGYLYTRDLVLNTGEFSYLFVPLKFIATWFTAWSGVPAGMFSPLLSIGGGVGQSVYEFFMLENNHILLLVGMTGFLSAVIRAPLTAGFLAIEVMGVYSMIPLALLVSLLSDKISEKISPPLWITQKDILLNNISATK